MAALETARQEVEADSELVAARAACVDSLRQYVNRKLTASEFDEATIDEAMETLDKWYAVRGARIQPRGRQHRHRCRPTSASRPTVDARQQTTR